MAVSGYPIHDAHRITFLPIGEEVDAASNYCNSLLQ